jgi:hypothetical protein
VPPPVTNPASVVPTNEPALSTNPAALETVELTPTNPPAALPDNSAPGNRNSLLVGVGLLGMAIALGLVFWLRPRRKDASLITRSLNERK